jgi:hypothetical protein
MRFNLICSICCILLVSRIEAQNAVDSVNVVLEYEGEYFMPNSFGIIEESLSVSPELNRKKPSQVSLIKRKLELCSSLFKKDSIISHSNGLKIILKKEIGPMDGYSELVRWIPSKFEVAIYTTLARNSMPSWNNQPDASIIIYFNNPGKLVGNPIIHDIYLEPNEISDFYQWPEFDRISTPNRVISFKNNDLEYFEPISREDFILTLIAYFQGSIEKTEKEAVTRANSPGISSKAPGKENDLKKYAEDLEEIRKFDPQLADKLMQAYIAAGGSSVAEESGKEVDNIIVLNSWREAVRKLKAEMNSMSSLELKSQAWWSNTEESNVSGLTPAGYIGSRPLIRLNKNLIDKTKPLTSTQLIVAEWSVLPGTEFEETGGYNLAYHRLSEMGLDEDLWNQISKLLDP